jgi:glycosyltransferase involved in cell wall biosynthesis
VVTGTVDDVRPYIAHAAVIVAPLRIARGIQNKVLEAMAMARPVVATTNCAAPIDAKVGDELLAAADVTEFVAQIETLLSDRARGDAIGRHARDRVVAGYSWDAHLSRLDSYLEPTCP